MPGTTSRHHSAVPYLYFEDVAGGIAWLTAAFGFSERLRLNLPNGFVAHAELELDGAVVMLGGVGRKNAGPRPDRVRFGVYIFVDEVDSHYETARAAGAEIVDPPEDQPFGDRIDLARDPEGHEWYFAQHLRDVNVDELGVGTPT